MSKASQLRQKAQNFLKKGKITDAIEAYKKLLQVESRNPNLYNELGDIYLRAEDRMQAVSSFEKAVDNYEKVALYNNAVAVCKKILRVVPNRLESIYKLGELKAKQKFNGEASRMFMQYLELAFADEADPMRNNLRPKVEAILELVPEDDELHERAAELLTHAGNKISAAEVFARLIARSVGSGDVEKTDTYREKLDLLRGSLSADEQTRIEEILLGSLELEDDGEEPDGEELDEEPDLTVEEIDTTAAASPAGSDPAAEQEAGEMPAAGEEQAVEEPATTGDHEVPAGPESGSGQDREYEIPEEPAEKVGDEAPPERESAEQRVMGETPVDAAEAEPEAGVSIPEDDLPNILDAEDAANEAAVSDTERFAEEITSDVEENDFRSHYDLGMAYIEMALYNEAIRELQISSRSEQLQLRSLEMIGHCFLLLENPRLAVKQLNRGLEIAMTIGGDNLGIHYNLGLAFEALNDTEKAREHFEEVYIVDVTFRDISKKMKKYSTVS